MTGETGGAASPRGAAATAAHRSVAWPLVFAPPDAALRWLAVGLSLWAFIAACQALAVGAPPARRWRRLRALMLVALLLALLWQPATPSQLAVVAPSQALLLLDDSCSMRAPSSDAANAPARQQEAERALGRIAEQIAARDDSVHVAYAALTAGRAANGAFVPSERGRQPGQADPSRAPACAQATDLLAALELAASRDDLPVTAAYLASDGLERGAGQWLPSDEARARALGFPVHTLAIGAQLPDVAIEAVHHSQVAFLKTEVPIEVVLRSEHVSKRPVEVTLWLGPERLASKRIVLTGGHQTVGFGLRFETLGRKTLLATVWHDGEDKDPRNNERAFSLQILRDKIRVLHVLGAPSFDGRAVREALRRSKNVDVVSFYILRSPRSEALVSEHELSLIPFPVARLFTSELKNFDAVVLQNFDPRPFGLAGQLAELSAAIDAGLGVAMVGGPHSFAEGGFVQTSLARTLPSELLPIDQVPAMAPAYQPKLASQAARHPLLVGHERLHDEALWQTLAPVSLQPSGALQPGASVLVAGRPVASPGSAATSWPLLSARAVGRGRTVALTTAEHWRWGFGPAPDAQDVLASLWQSILGYLVHDADDGALTLRLSEPLPRANERFEVVLELLANDYTPLAGVQVTLQQRWLPSALPVAQPPAGRPQVGVTDAAGQLRLGICATAGGRLLLEARAADEKQAAASAVVAVLPSLEQEQLQPAEGWLASLSAATGGTAVQSSASLPASGEHGPLAAAPQRLLPWHKPLWPRPWLVAGVFAALLAHFWLSKGHDF